MIKNNPVKNAVVLALVLAGWSVGAPIRAQADPGELYPHKPENFNCAAWAVPKAKYRCQSNVVLAPGYEPFSCSAPKDLDQRTYCGAIYEYEANWCKQIKNQALREQCVLDSE